MNFILPYLSVAYLFVLLWFTTKLVIQLQTANSLRRKRITTASEDLQNFFEFLVESMGIKRTIQLVISRQIDIPSTLGFLKPIVLLPAAAVAHLTPAQLEAVLLHELAHIKRNDYFWNLLLSVAETMLFFNPFALLLIGMARKERENSCDDAFAYMHDPGMDEEIRMTQENIQIIVKNNSVFLNGKPFVNVDTVHLQQPPQPQRILKKLEIIRL